MTRTDFTIPEILAEAERQLARGDIIRITRSQWLAIVTELARAQSQVEEA